MALFEAQCHCLSNSPAVLGRSSYAPLFLIQSPNVGFRGKFNEGHYSRELSKVFRPRTSDLSWATLYNPCLYSQPRLISLVLLFGRMGDRCQPKIRPKAVASSDFDGGKAVVLKNTTEWRVVLVRERSS